MTHYIEHEPDDDDVDRRGFLKCMAWAGTGVVFTLAGCGATTTRLGSAPAAKPTGSFSFVQISDSHIGFDKAANKHVIGTLEQCVARINALPQRPSFVVHTGDHVHLSTPAEFDTVKQILGTIKTDRVFNVPGEHDVFVDQGRRYHQFFGKAPAGPATTPSTSAACTSWPWPTCRRPKRRARPTTTGWACSAQSSWPSSSETSLRDRRTLRS
ncbi:MAG TPA: metallophosphoesterase [Solirubrobacteraceae bacterium]|nr:metallophosphoesterase [Solirubrobacteraceae bacterium]